MTRGLPPKMGTLIAIQDLRKEIDESETQEEYVDPGSLIIARAILVLAEVQLLAIR